MASDRAIKCGFIGAGGIGETHFEAVRRLGGAEVVAICRRDKEWATAYAKKHGVPKVYTDYRDLVADDEIEVVNIATPNYLHFEQIMAALEAGKHVVVDKPLGIAVEQTGAMLALARQKKLANAVSYNHRFLPLIFHMREMVRRGDLGKLTLIRGYILDDFMLAISDIAPDHWRTKPDTVGSSKTMSTMGGHLIDLLQFISGLRVQEVFADFGYVDSGKPPLAVAGKAGQLEDHANLLVRFGNGVVGAITLSEAAPGHKVEVFLEMVGTEGCAAWNLQKINEIWIGCRTQPNRLLYKGAEHLYPEAVAIAAPPSWGQDGFSDSFRAFYDSVYTHIRESKYLQDDVRPDFATFEDGHYMELILHAMVRSAGEATWQKIEYRPRGAQSSGRAGPEATSPIRVA